MVYEVAYLFGAGATMPLLLCVSPWALPLNVEILDIEGIVLDEFTAR